MLYRHKRTIPAGQSVQIDAAGDFVRYRMGSSEGSTEVVVRTSRGAEVAFQVGESFSVPGGFNSITISNENAADITVNLLLGYGKSDGSSSVVVSNALTVADSAALRSKSGSSYIGSGVLPAVVNNAVQLWNPAGNNVNFFVRKVEAPTATQDMRAWFHNSQIPAGAACELTNKRPDGTGSGAAIRQSLIATLVAGAGVIRIPSSASLSRPLIENPNEPLCIPPGWGVTVQTANNSGGQVSFDFWAE